ncbi:hypothetical protein [Microvirga sp. TS319]|uniref:TY-Chap domain-containing protein n=1 Tax=Microvirga sp. TS319 TaxID=3241165 RepID=UPI00351A2DAB
MVHWRKVLQVTILVLTVPAVDSISAIAQQRDEPSCTGTMTQQLRRFSEQCLSDVVTFVESQPGMTAKIYGEQEKYFITLTRTDQGLLAEAVSKYNYPLMKPDTPDILKQLGWAPPENESDNWTKTIGLGRGASGDAAQEVSRALSAYGLKHGEAISLTVGPKIAD